MIRIFPFNTFTGALNWLFDAFGGDALPPGCLEKLYPSYPKGSSRRRKSSSEKKKERQKRLADKRVFYFWLPEKAKLDMKPW